MISRQMWQREAREHWEENRPKMFAAMVKAGTLDQELAAAEEETATLL